jgi:hypothetical protein
MPAAGKTVRVNQTKDRSEFFKFYASATGDIDILGEGPTGLDELPCAEVHIFTGGSLAVVRKDGVTVNLSSVPDGYMLPFTIIKILQTGTTATNILVMW